MPSMGLSSTAAAVPYTPSGDIASDDVAAALAELDTEKLDAPAAVVTVQTFS